MSSPGLWSRDRPSRHQRHPRALGLLHHSRDVLGEQESAPRQRVGVAPDELHVACSVAVALDDARPGGAPPLALRPITRERNEGPDASRKLAPLMPAVAG